MLEINGSDIYLTKGDTAHLSVGITNDASGDAYEMQPDDTLILTVRNQAYEASPVLLQKMMWSCGRARTSTPSSSVVCSNCWKR